MVLCCVDRGIVVVAAATVTGMKSVCEQLFRCLWQITWLICNQVLE